MLLKKLLSLVLSFACVLPTLAEAQDLNPADWRTIPGTQQPVIERRVDDGRTFRMYTAGIEHVRTGERGVVVSIWRSNRPWWERRLFECSNLNELWPCAADGGTMQPRAIRSWFSSLFDRIRDAIDAIVSALSGVRRELAGIMREVGEFFTEFGKKVLDVADAVDHADAVAVYARAVYEVRGQANVPTYRKLQQVLERATLYDLSGRTTRTLSQAILEWR